VAPDHPVAAALAARGVVAAVGEVAAAGRGGGWQGLDALAAELERETGVAIRHEALEELARRTLRRGRDGRREREGGAEAESTARLASEYRKLAALARGSGAQSAAGPGGGAARIERAMVEEAVSDRGQEDVFKILDAVGAGRGGEALSRLSRLLAAAEDPVAERLSFFALLAALCRQLAALPGLMKLAGVSPGESNFKRFEVQHAPRLQAALPGGGKNPLAGLHPYRLHRAYLAACRLPEATLATLPSVVLETEQRLKGGSGDPDAALASLIGRLAAPLPGARR